MDESYLDKDPSWMKTAEVEDLRAFMRLLDRQPNTQKVRALYDHLDIECERRANADYETRSGGEWI